MNRNTHEKIIVVLKTLMFAAFFLNVIRVCIKTWKYGGSTSRVEVSFEGDDDIPTEEGDL